MHRSLGTTGRTVRRGILFFEVDFVENVLNLPEKSYFPLACFAFVVIRNIYFIRFYIPEGLIEGPFFFFASRFLEGKS